MRKRMTTLLVIAGLVLSACTAPTKQYIAADGYGMYLALPKDWVQVPGRQMEKAESGWTDDAGDVFRETVRWQGAWSPRSLTADAVFSDTPTAEPVVFGFVRDLISVERSAVGSDVRAALRDLVLPVSSLSPGTVTTKSVRSGSFRGVRQSASYVSGGALQTTTVFSVLSPSRDRVYVLTARCTQRCAVANSRVLADVFDSLTFKEPRG